MKKIGDFSTEMQDCADIDLCLRSREKGLWNVWACFADVAYAGDNTAEDYWKQCDLFKKKWKETIEAGDEFYHPLLKALKRYRRKYGYNKFGKKSISYNTGKTVLVDV